LNKYEYVQIKNFAEDGILTYTSRLRKIYEVENMDKDDFINFFKDLKKELM
jgi:hypothetical protein